MSREEVIQHGGPAAMVGGAMRTCALGSILKEANQNEVLRAIQAVANRGVIFGPGIARRVMGLFSTERSQTSQAFPKLTEREREMLLMIAQDVTTPRSPPNSSSASRRHRTTSRTF